MGPAAIFTLILTLVAAGLLITEKIRPDLVALLVLVSLGLSGIVSPDELFSGFGGAAVMTILAISIISEGLHQTGVGQYLAKFMEQAAGKTEVRLVLVVMLTSAGLSLVMNNIAVVGVLLPAVTSLTRRTQVAPSKLLMPLAFGTTLGGMATLLTTSNIIVSGVLRESGVIPFNLLDFLPIGIPIVVVGTAYMVLLGRRWLPNRFPVGEMRRVQLLRTELTRMYEIEKNLVEIEVLPGSSMANRTIAQGQWARDLDFNILGIARDGHVIIAPSTQEMIRTGDVILAQGIPDPARLHQQGCRLLVETRISHAVADETVSLAEVVVSPHATTIGKTLRDIRFRERFGLNVLAIWRTGKPIQTDLADLPIQFGDALLVQGPAHRINLLRAERDFILLEEDPDAVLNPRKGRLAMWITLLTLGIAATGILPIAVVALAGAVLMLLTGCLDLTDAYRSIEWRAIFLIAGMWPLSLAIRSTGLAMMGMDMLLEALGAITPLALAAVLIFITFAVTQFMGGQVSSLVVAPLAIAASGLTGVDPRALGMAVALGCSLAFPTPYGHPVNIMVLGPGGYTARDFLRVGSPLTILAFLMILAGLSVFWGL